ncbi:DEP domain-containing protein 1A isoform X1 [Xyrichtys novacula]|uniref:DEP domain-containing protein 1A isoform X1 n=1 Tax=Xyrichtys novacula TaxID=13765 RepID=A0AAV1FJI4_XYRNO|nr:DEP domain-containing protein 1A isoform X1 [Xyrichtys novacula]
MNWSNLLLIPTDDLPHWVLSAMKSLANWPKYDSAQPSYPGFERDVFKTVSDYFYSLPQPLLTYELYELFINVLVFCGYVAAPAAHQRGKRKKHDLPSAPPPAKASFRSTECLLLSLLRQGACDETESPMRDVLGGKFQSRMAALRGGGGEGLLGGSCISLSAAVSMRPQTRSCSLETILDDSAPLTRQQLFLSSDSLASFAQSSGSQEDSPVTTTPHTHTDFPSVSKAAPVAREIAPGVRTRNRLSVASFGGVSGTQRLRPSRPRSVGSCLDIVVETREEDVKETGKLQDRATSCLDVNTPAHQHHSSSASHPPPLSSYHPVSFFSSSATAKAQGSRLTAAPGGPRPAASTSNLWTLPAPAVVRRCLSSLDVSKQPRPVSLLKPPVRVPTGNSQPAQTKAEQSVLQPHCERVAIEALQLCTLLLPPTSRRKLQLLMRMMSRISQNVDMPRLHPAIGTRTLMVHTFSGCVLGSAEEGDLDELLATRLVSFLMDHQESILSVPEYLRSAINGHIQYLRAVQVPVDGAADGDSEDPGCAPVPIYAFCHQISGAEFEQQKLEASQKAMEELLEILLTDQSMSEKDRRKKLKQFQKQYPDIYNRRCPPSERENSKPKIKPPLLNIKKTKAFSIRN